MKRMVVAGLFFAVALHAQTIAGVWQGTLPVAATAQGPAGGAGLRIAITVEKKPDGSLRGVMALIDRGNTIPISSTTFSAPNICFTLGDDARACY